MNLIDVLLPEIMPQLTGCDEELAKNEIRKAARKFAVETESLREVTEFQQENAFSAITIPIAMPGKLLRVHQLEINQSHVPNREFVVNAADKKLVFLFPHGNNNQTNRIQAVCAMIPPLSMDEFPDEWLIRCGDGIAAATLFTLYNYPGRPYSNPAAAQHQQMQFARERARIIMAISKGCNAAPQTIDLSAGRIF